MPVLMPWAEQVAAIVHAWLPGQEFGPALADVLLGAAEPGGRLPVTLPVAEADCPVLHATPDADGVLGYDEGLLIGYRGYDKRGTTPRYSFGHGLGYTTWAYESIDCPAALADGADLEFTVTVRNTGSRPGKEIVQAYLSEPGRAAAPRPARAHPGGVRGRPGRARRRRGGPAADTGPRLRPLRRGPRQLGLGRGRVHGAGRQFLARTPAFGAGQQRGSDAE